LKGGLFSLSKRDVYWKEAGRLIGDFPFLGVGLNNYSIVSANYKDRLGWGGYPHNCYLHMAAEIGLVGLGAFLLFIYKLFKKALNNLKNIREQSIKVLLYGLLAGLFGFLIHSFFDTSFYSVKLDNLLWIIMGLIMAVQNIYSANNN